MIRPIPPKFKVLIAGIVLVIGGLSATRFPADKSEKLFIAHKTNAVSSSPQDSGINLLHPPTALSLNDSNFPEAPISENDEQEVLFDITSSYSTDSADLPEEDAEEEQPEEQTYIPFQDNKPVVSRAENNEFHRSGPSPPVIAPASIRSDDPVSPGLGGQQTLSLPPLAPVTYQQIDAVPSSAIVFIPTTTTSQNVFYPDAKKTSSSNGNVVTAHGSAVILPQSVSGRDHR